METIDISNYRRVTSINDIEFREPTEDEMSLIKKLNSSSAAFLAIFLGIFVLAALYVEYLIIESAIEGSLGLSIAIVVGIIIAAFICGLIVLILRFTDKPVGVLKGVVIDAEKKRLTQSLDFETTHDAYTYDLTIRFDHENAVLEGVSDTNFKPAAQTVDWTTQINSEVLLVMYKKGGWNTVLL